MAEESSRQEESFARWEESLDLHCDDPNCEQKPIYLVHLHADPKMRHGTAFACEDCQKKAREVNQTVIDNYGVCSCPLCSNVFTTVEAWMKSELL